MSRLEPKAVAAPIALRHARAPASVRGGRSAAFDAAAKRLLDIVGASLLLVPAALLMVAAGIAVRIESPGRVVIRQPRVGRDGRVFPMLKLRTMVDGRHPYRPKVRDDARVTRVGRLLRTTSIDELPQLWNVLRGEMSLLGPRPLPVDEYLARGCPGGARLTVRPGLSGPWQVAGRSLLPFEQRLALDDAYAREWTLAGDLLLLAKTVPAVLRRRGAY